MERAQGETREAQDKCSTQQGMISTQMEEINKSVEGMPELMEYVHQAQRSTLLGVPKEAVAQDPVVDGGEDYNGTRTERVAVVDGAPNAEEPVDEEESATDASITDEVDAKVVGGDEPPRQRAEPPGGYKTPVRPARKLTKKAARARAKVKAWSLERRKTRTLEGKGEEHEG